MSGELFSRKYVSACPTSISGILIPEMRCEYLATRYGGIMNVTEAQKVLQDIFGAETKVFAREDHIAGSKKVLRPLNEGESPDDHKGRFLIGEKLVVLGQGKEWSQAVEAAILPELVKRRKAAELRGRHAAHQGELFAVFLRERYSSEFETWTKESETAKKMQADFEADLEKRFPKDPPKEEK